MPLLHRLILSSIAALTLGAAAEPSRVMPLEGAARSVLVLPEQTLLDIAFEERLGFDAIQRLNPTLDPWIPLPGSVVRLPTRYVLPPVEPTGLVINVPEMRLYDFTTDPHEVFAAAIGDQADPSLLGAYRIGDKRKDPAWHVPASIRAEEPQLPAVVPPGPDNPLGSRWMTIGSTSYGLHGTNVRWSIGRLATHGCIRLYDDEVARLYDRTPTGTPIRLVYEPFKWGLDGRNLYLEVHPDVYARHPDRLTDALRTLNAERMLPFIELESVWRALEEARGVPILVGQLPRSLGDGAATSPPTS